MLYNINKKLRKENPHTIRNDFGFNLLRSAGNLKRGVIDGTDGLFWFFVIVDFSSSLYIVGFVNRDEDIFRESFSVKFILHSS
jgi:hypothetical protein